MTLELGIDVASCGSLTCKREDLQRGFEPDECYYIENEALMRGRRDVDFMRDPPPDLIVDVDISRSSVVRHGIFAAFGVPEIWRFDGEKLLFLALRLLVEGVPVPPVGTLPAENLPSGADSGRPPAESDYVEVPASRSFPFLAPADLEPFLARHGEESETSIVAAFRDRVREVIAGR